jgi:hypothetical protein
MCPAAQGIIDGRCRDTESTGVPLSGSLTGRAAKLFDVRHAELSRDVPPVTMKSPCGDGAQGVFLLGDPLEVVGPVIGLVAVDVVDYPLAGLWRRQKSGRDQDVNGLDHAILSAWYP